MYESVNAINCLQISVS